MPRTGDARAAGGVYERGAVAPGLERVWQGPALRTASHAPEERLTVLELHGRGAASGSRLTTNAGGAGPHDGDGVSDSQSSAVRALCHDPEGRCDHDPQIGEELMSLSIGYPWPAPT
jgi:hypothetical protein